MVWKGSTQESTVACKLRVVGVRGKSRGILLRQEGKGKKVEFRDLQRCRGLLCGGPVGLLGREFTDTPIDYPGGTS